MGKWMNKKGNYFTNKLKNMDVPEGAKYLKLTGYGEQENEQTWWSYRDNATGIEMQWVLDSFSISKEKNWDWSHYDEISWD